MHLSKHKSISQDPELESDFKLSSGYSQTTVDLTAVCSSKTPVRSNENMRFTLELIYVPVIIIQRQL